MIYQPGDLPVMVQEFSGPRVIGCTFLAPRLKGCGAPCSFSKKENGLFYFRREENDREKTGMGLHDRHLCPGSHKGGGRNAVFTGAYGSGGGDDPERGDGTLPGRGNPV